MLDFEVNFWYLHEQYQLSMTLKVHVIIDHYVWYFKEMNKNFYDTNGEYVEAVHYSLDGHEKTRNLKVKRNLGSDEHLERALNSFTAKYGTFRSRLFKQLILELTF